MDDKVPANWVEVEEQSKKLTAVNKLPAFGYPPEDQYPAWTMSNLVWGFGGQWSNEWDFDTVANADTTAALTFAQNSVKDGWATVVSDDQTIDFSAGAISQTIASTGSLKGIIDAADFEVGVGFLPAGPKESELVVPTGGAGVAVAANTTPEKKLAAAMFAAFLTDKEHAAVFSAWTGYLPVQKDADMSEVYDKVPEFKVAVEQLERARSQDYARVFVPGGDLALAKSLQSILVNGADVQTTTNGVKDELQVLFDRDLADRLN